MKEGRGNKDFKKGGKLGQGVGALKGGGVSGTPLWTIVLLKNFAKFTEKYLYQSLNIVTLQHFSPQLLVEQLDACFWKSAA